MTPAARIQAAIEVLDLVIDAARSNGPPADRILSSWFKTRRFAGSGDRRAVRELTYRAIRTCGELPQNGRAAMLFLAAQDPSLAGLFDGSRHGPSPIVPGEPSAAGGIAPAWLVKSLEESGIGGEEAAALLDRAPLDIRVNTLKSSRDAITLPVDAEITSAPGGLRLAAGTQVEQWPQWLDGLVEIQDTGSQIACLAVGAQPSETVIDLCAGAGGKTLCLAANMENRGQIVASDTDRGRLSRLGPRMQRAGASNIETILLNPKRESEALGQWAGKADAVLVDAPCSGIGTWRRNPEARWRLDSGRLDGYTELQARLLDIAAPLVRPGGRIIYVTCSLLDAEGKGQVDDFLARHPEFQAYLPDLPAGRVHGKGMRLTPLHDGTDGFFIAGFTHLC